MQFGSNLQMFVVRYCSNFKPHNVAFYKTVGILSKMPSRYTDDSALAMVLIHLVWSPAAATSQALCKALSRGIRQAHSHCSRFYLTLAEAAVSQTNLIFIIEVRRCHKLLSSSVSSITDSIC